MDFPTRNRDLSIFHKGKMSAYFSVETLIPLYIHAENRNEYFLTYNMEFCTFYVW